MCPDFKTLGQWNITVKDLTTGETEDHVFDAVMLCTGHHADKNTPEFPGNQIYFCYLPIRTVYDVNE
jgi:dimethylaniline monooxygenase (N-oxide forming)